MAQVREIGNLDQLMDGAVNERFNLALRQVLDNIFDPNTKPTATRKLTLTITVKPNKDRMGGEWLVDTKPTLAAPMPLEQTVMFTRYDDGTVTATEYTDQIPGQVNIDGDEFIPNVVTFGKKQIAEGE